MEEDKENRLDGEGQHPQILIIEPYYGGSHRTFLESLSQHLPFAFEFLTLPARKWKWRMRLAAITFAEELQNTPPADIILCSTFVDVAALRALSPLWVKQRPILTYFHENQFAYPVRVESERDFHFALTNYTTALASDGLAFNSQYNLNSFLDGVESLLKKADDMHMSSGELAIRKKSVVIPPGIDSSFDDNIYERDSRDAPVIIWNHRWEHDKNPELFFQTLYRLDEEKIPFKVVVLGQAFERRPQIFEEARQKLSHRLLHFGFCSSREEYIRWLQQGDIVVSTAEHEFFGLAVLEAVRAGCRPVLPNRLSYPELFPREFLYNGDKLYQALKAALVKGRLAQKAAFGLTENYTWDVLADKFRNWFNNDCL